MRRGSWSCVVQLAEQNVFETISFRFVFSLFRFELYRFGLVFVLLDFFFAVSISVNGFITFPLTDISVSINGNHTGLKVSRGNFVVNCPCSMTVTESWRKVSMKELIIQLMESSMMYVALLLWLSSVLHVE